MDLLVCRKSLKSKLDEIRSKFADKEIKYCGSIRLRESPSYGSEAEIISNNTDIKHNKKRCRRRQKKVNIESGSLFSDVKIDGEILLILDLLNTPFNQWIEFLSKAAVEKNILVKEPHSGDLIYNPKIEKYGKDIFRFGYKKNQITDLANNSESQTGLNHYYKRPEVSNFEIIVNTIVGEELNQYQKDCFTFCGTGDKTGDYFDDDNYNEQLEKFAHKCVEANLGVIIESDVRVNAKNSSQAFLKYSSQCSDAILESFTARKFSFHGDIVRAFVRVCVKPERVYNDICVDKIEGLLNINKSCKAFVIKIMKKNHSRKCVGNATIQNNFIINIEPRDRKIPHIIVRPRFSKMEELHINLNTLYYVDIIGFENEQCIGKIIQKIGECGDSESENKAILIQNNLDFEPYPAHSLNILNTCEDKFAEEIRKRQDIRFECVFTIDPPGACDLDDALSCRSMQNGNYEIGVHISDVSYYIEERSELDEIASNRGNSIYLTNKVIHMLPEILCEKCSLLPGKDKLAFSVFWEITPNCEILNTRISKTAINSCVQLTYDHAQEMIDNLEKEYVETDFPKIYNGFSIHEVHKKIKMLASIGEKLRAKRFINGAIKIDKPKLCFDLNPITFEPESYYVYKQGPANYMIEEFMLLANQSVATAIYKHFPKISILRNHGAPNQIMLTTLKEKIEKLGFNLDISTSKALYASIQAIAQNNKLPSDIAIAMSALISKSMMRANYFCSEYNATKDFWHYALSIPIYTHFTSPIRRYPDLLVHRALNAVINYAEPPMRLPKELHTVAIHCNKRKYSAKLASEESNYLYFIKYVQSKNSVNIRAYILEIFNYGINALLETGHEITIRFQDQKHINVKLDKSIKPLGVVCQFKKTNKKSITLKMLTHIYVEISVWQYKLKANIISDSSLE